VNVTGKRITKYGFVLLVIVLIGLFARIYQLSTQSMWLDEVGSVRLAQLTLPEIVQTLQGDNQPPLYFFILHYWIMPFGISAPAVRLLSVLFGVLAIPMIYLVGRQLFNEEVGLVGALILALSTFNIIYSQQTRAYALMVLLALLSAYFFLRFLQRSSLALSAGYVLSTTLLIYTHYYGVLVVVAENIYLVTLLALSKHRTYKLRDWVVLQVIVAALFIPWTLVLRQQILRNEGTGSLLAQSPAAAIIQTFVSYAGDPVLLALFLGLSVLSVVAVQKVRGSMDWKAPLKALQNYSLELRRQDLLPVYFLVVWLLAVTLITSLIAVGVPIGAEKYAIAGSVALYLLVAKGITNINYRPAKVAVIGVIILISVLNVPVTSEASSHIWISPQAREATQFIDANAKSGDVVLLWPEYQSLPFNYYNNRTDLAVNPILTFLLAWCVSKRE